MIASKKKRENSPKVEWIDAPTKLVSKCVFMEVYGDTGTGRTWLALTAPGPIAYLNAAEKWEGVLQAAARIKKIRYVDFAQQANRGPGKKRNRAAIAKDASVNWYRLRDAWYDSFSWARTIVVDTHTDAWELLRITRFGGLTPETGRVDANYGPVNAEWLSMWKYFKSQNETNVIMIGQTKPEYTGGGKGKMGQATGLTVAAGQRNIPIMCDVRVRTNKDILNPAAGFSAEIIKGWYNAQSEGEELWNEDCTFSAVMGLVTGNETAWDF